MKSKEECNNKVCPLSVKELSTDKNSKIFIDDLTHKVISISSSTITIYNKSMNKVKKVLYLQSKSKFKF